VKDGPQADVIGFLDADHILDQGSFDELVRAFGQAMPPDAVQGICAASNRDPNALARLLEVERRWLELTELLAGPRLGEVCHFGGGQGFFRHHVLEDPGIQIDEAMILDDIDLSCRMALAGYRVVFDPFVRTTSSQPEPVAGFLDQRTRWTRGWVQLMRKHASASFRLKRTPLSVRLSLLGLLLTPYALAWSAVGVLAGVAALTGVAPACPTWLALAGILWPVAMVPGPYIAGAGPGRVLDFPLVAVGVPLLAYAYFWLCAVAVVDAVLIRRPIRYAKTLKPADGVTCGPMPH
jgi:cellulose synthase/poly-beta-1,6-N-acetylglucosamine synthase-like glycosyltransferase